MSDYGFWAVLAGFELFGIIAVTNPSGLMEWVTPKIEPQQHSKMKPILEFIGWSFISIPLLLAICFGRKS